MTLRMIAASLMALTVMATATFSPAAEQGDRQPPRRMRTPDRPGGAPPAARPDTPLPDELARKAREINRWLREHPQIAERIIRNFMEHRRGQVGPAGADRPVRRAEPMPRFRRQPRQGRGLIGQMLRRRMARRRRWPGAGGRWDRPAPAAEPRRLGPPDPRRLTPPRARRPDMPRRDTPDRRPFDMRRPQPTPGPMARRGLGAMQRPQWREPERLQRREREGPRRQDEGFWPSPRPLRELRTRERVEQGEPQPQRLREFMERLEARSRELDEQAARIERRLEELKRWAAELQERGRQRWGERARPQDRDRPREREPER